MFKRRDTRKTSLQCSLYHKTDKKTKHQLDKKLTALDSMFLKYNDLLSSLGVQIGLNSNLLVPSHPVLISKNFSLIFRKSSSSFLIVKKFYFTFECHVYCILLHFYYFNHLYLLLGLRCRS